jgi:hypothetical protein
VAIRALNEAGDEGKYSPEGTFNLSGTPSIPLNSASSKLVLQSVKVISSTRLDLSFNKALDSSPTAQRDVKILKQ